MKYPSRVCQSCGDKASGTRVNLIATWHEGKCDVCGKIKPVTEPRDFGYPKFGSPWEIRIQSKDLPNREFKTTLEFETAFEKERNRNENRDIH